MGMELLIGAAVVATGAQAVYANEAADAQRDAARAQNAQQTLQNTRAMRQTIRSARIAAAERTAQAAGQGVLDTSGFEGGQSSIMSQLGSSLGFGIQMIEHGDQAARRLGNASQMSNMASLFGGVASLALQGASLSARKPTTPAEAAPITYAQTPLTSGGGNRRALFVDNPFEGIY